MHISFSHSFRAETRQVSPCLFGLFFFPSSRRSTYLADQALLRKSHLERSSALLTNSTSFLRYSANPQLGGDHHLPGTDEKSAPFIKDQRRDVSLPVHLVVLELTNLVVVNLEAMHAILRFWSVGGKEFHSINSPSIFCSLDLERDECNSDGVPPMFQ